MAGDDNLSMGCSQRRVLLERRSGRGPLCPYIGCEVKVNSVSQLEVCLYSLFLHKFCFIIFSMCYTETSECA